MLAWWQELKEVLGQDNLQEFAWRVWASFEVPKAWSCMVKVENDHSMLPALHSLDRDWFMPLPDIRFGSQDFCLTQPQKTLVYVKTYGQKRPQPPIPGKPHYLAESILKLWQTMELPTTFIDKEVLEDVLPSNWVKITPSRSAEPPEWEHIHSRTHWAHARGSFLAVCGEGWPGPYTPAIALMATQATTT